MGLSTLAGWIYYVNPLHEHLLFSCVTVKILSKERERLNLKERIPSLKKFIESGKMIFPFTQTGIKILDIAFRFM